MEFTGKLKYVGLELMKNDAKSTDEPEVGLFRGIRTRTEGDKVLSLILLGDQDNPDSIRGLNKDVFNIMTVLLKYGDCREMIVFKNDDVDQGLANEMLDELIEKLKKDKLMLDSDPDIVDTEKFVEVDKEFFGANKKLKNTNSTYGTGKTNTTTTTGTPEWKKKQEEEKKEKARQEKLRWTPFPIGRDSDKPAIKDLNLIKKKIAAVAAGEYANENFPHLPGDPPEEDKKDDKKTGAAAG